MQTPKRYNPSKHPVKTSPPPKGYFRKSMDKMQKNLNPKFHPAIKPKRGK